MADQNFYDLVIIGTGPAGLACSVYASRFKLDHLVIGQLFGGTITEAVSVENYIGIESIAGAELGVKMFEHAKSYGAEILQKEVERVEKVEGGFVTRTADGDEFQSRTVFLGLGTRVRRLDVPGEKEFLGKGVSYCSLCDAMFYRAKDVVIVGGGNSAVTAAIHLSKIASSVRLVVRGETLAADPVWQDRLVGLGNITTVFGTGITEILGTEKVEAVKLDRPFEGKDRLEVQGVMVEIGVVPATEISRSLGLETTPDGGFIKIAPDGSTNVSGVYAGGDVATATGGREPCQLVTAVSEGAQTAISVFKYLRTLV